MHFQNMNFRNELIKNKIRITNLMALGASTIDVPDRMETDLTPIVYFIGLFTDVREGWFFRVWYTL